MMDLSPVYVDLFFFISGAGFLVLGLLCAVLLAYGIAIARDIRRITSLTKKEVEEVIEDVGTLRREVKATVRAGKTAARGALMGVGVGELLSFLTATLTDARRHKKAREDAVTGMPTSKKEEGGVPYGEERER